MKRKLILSLLAVLLAVAMLLPLASCALIEKAGAEGERGKDGADVVPSPCESSESPEFSTEGAVTEKKPVIHHVTKDYGDPIPHTPEMLALKEKWENSDEEWAKKLGEILFMDYYKTSNARKGDKYRIMISGWDEETLQLILTTMDEIGVAKEDHHGFSRQWKMLSIFATAEQIEALAKLNGDFRISSDRDATNPF